MIEFACHDYGFRCNFKVKGDDKFKVIELFDKHCFEKHKIDYGKEALMQFIVRKRV